MTSYTHGHAESVLRSHRTRTATNSAGYLLPHLRPGQSLLDVGSGPGHVAAYLSGRGARVVAADLSPAMCALAHGERGLPACAADLTALGIL